MWRWWRWWWSDAKVEPNPSEERSLPPILGALNPLLVVNLHPPIPSTHATGGKLTPGPFEPQNKQLQQYCSSKTKSASKTEALCPPAAGQGESKRARGIVIREEHTKQQQQQQDSEAQQLCWNQEVGLDLLSGGRKMCSATRAKM